MCRKFKGPDADLRISPVFAVSFGEDAPKDKAQSKAKAGAGNAKARSAGAQMPTDAEAEDFLGLQDRKFQDFASDHFQGNPSLAMVYAQTYYPDDSKLMIITIVHIIGSEVGSAWAQSWLDLTSFWQFKHGDTVIQRQLLRPSAITSRNQRTTVTEGVPACGCLLRIRV